MTSYEQEFLSTGQEPRRLSIALRQFILTEDPQWKERYERYLSSRFRPAMSELIHQGDFLRIKKLCQFAPLTEASLNSFIMDASAKHHDEILIFLLELKKTRFGFHDRTFTL